MGNSNLLYLRMPSLHIFTEGTKDTDKFMLTDIFADRYVSIPMWETFGEIDERFLVQGFRIVSEQLYPFYVGGNKSKQAETRWIAIHDKLSMELGLTQLAPKAYSYQGVWNGKPHTYSGVWEMDKICKDFVCAKYDGSVSADRFMKERISFIELAFREKEKELNKENQELPMQLVAAEIQDKSNEYRAMRFPGNRADGIKAYNDSLNNNFRVSVDELNERLRRAGFNLNYHNGFIQISDDELVEEQIEKEFWSITKDVLWKNVDIDMKEAIDLRDSDGRDPSLYAAKALESTIKIISDEKKWTHGSEKGAHNYIDNLSSKTNGKFIDAWESDTLKSFFTSVRNPLGHGPGNEVMPTLTSQQTNWAIETCMSWIKSLVKRM